MSKAVAVKGGMASVATATVVEAEYPAKGFHLEVSVAPEQVAAAAAALDQEGFFLEAITGVDWLGEKEALRKEAEKAKQAAAKAAEKAGAETADTTGGETGAEQPRETAVEQAANQVEEVAEPEEDELEVVYDYNHYQEPCRVVVRTRVVRSRPELPTVSGVFPAADWHERETHDFFGVVFTGHPDLSPLLLPDDADFHPLRKDYKA